MATSPIRIRDDDKERIEQLRTSLSITTGRRHTQQETVARLLAFVMGRKAEFLNQTTGPALSKGDIAFWLGRAEDLGDWTVDDIDDIVYGDAA